MAACQVVAQGVMVPVAAAVGPLADRVGRMPLFMAGLDEGRLSFSLKILVYK